MLSRGGNFPHLIRHRIVQDGGLATDVVFTKTFFFQAFKVELKIEKIKCNRCLFKTFGSYKHLKHQMGQNLSSIINLRFQG